MSITIKKRIPLLKLLISYISARPAPQVLSIKYECKNILTIGLCNSSANSLFYIFSFLAADLACEGIGTT